MRDIVEIGMGRTARRTYELDDINIVPSRRTRSSKDVSTAWQIDAYRFEIPVVTHPTDALVSPEFAIEMGRLGGLGILNVREAFAEEYPDIVRRVLAVYEQARKFSLGNYDELKRVFMAATRLPESVVDKQLKERTELTHNRIGAPQRASIMAAGAALQQAGVIPANVDVKAAVDGLIDDHFLPASN